MIIILHNYICIHVTAIPTTVDATASLCDALQIIPKTAHHHATSTQSTDEQTSFCVAVSTMPPGVSQSTDGQTPFCVAVSTMSPGVSQFTDGQTPFCVAVSTMSPGVSQFTDGQTPFCVAVSTMSPGVSQFTDGQTPFCVAVSTMPPMPHNICTTATTSAYSTALMPTPPPPSYGMNLDDREPFSMLPTQQRQITALAQQLRNYACCSSWWHKESRDF